uniref:ATP synthase complex subunit 8 n=1 Tax=Siphluriscus chinensis TaxID=981053 RepID=A0A067XG00_9INSE|nr:ATP synthase F0 subunit 8 [Siphluriscus chinensis]
MPQMAPLSWLLLFFTFIFALLIFSSMNYFLYSPSSPSSSKQAFKTSSFNWKW